MKTGDNAREAENTSELTPEADLTVPARPGRHTAARQRRPARDPRRYTLVAAVVLLILIGLAAGCLVVLRNSSNRAAYKGVPEKLVVSNIGEYTIFNLIAKQKGYFVQNGLDVEVREYDAGPRSIKDLLDKKIQIALASENAGVNNIFLHKNLKVLTRVSDQDVFQVIGRKDKGITVPADLKGKRIGVTTKSIGEFFLGRFLAVRNLGLQDVTVVDLTPKEMVAQIADGRVDAVLVFDPHAYNIRKNLGNAVISWPATNEQRTYTLLYALDEYTKAHPDTIKRYLRSLVMAETLYNKDAQVARNIGINNLHYTPEFIDTIWPRINFGLGLEQEILISMEDQARWAIENKLTDQTEVPNYLRSIYFDGLRSVKPEAITIID